MKISKKTRQNIFDTIKLERISWCGKLNEIDFLSRIYDLKNLPSHDPRYENSKGDIWQHRINNNDWDDDWVFFDSRFQLDEGDDDILLRFLCETLHPVVRNLFAAWSLLNIYNKYLKDDGFKIVENTEISGFPTYTVKYFGLIENTSINKVKDSFNKIDSAYVSSQIKRMDDALMGDETDLAIGTAKEFVETCCKTILANHNITIPENCNLPKLMKLTTKELSLAPEDISEQAKASNTIKKILSNLATITHGIAELRNDYGTGHGKVANAKGLAPRHAKLAVGAASTLAVFLHETYESRSKKII